mmetsp:Transcript_3258/g.3553  ORF Transcript_3258/g.3553 Transcript_3258/m.3553 type:complete len:442 (-) Transcript_3258:1458-2783(-)|eukprot:gene5087-5450_t
MQGLSSPESEIQQAEDTITALEYNITGDFLATGDRNGRITVLKLDNEGKNEKNQESWVPYFQFQSHEPEFDFLKSLEMEGKINQIKFCHPIANNNFILSTNDKTIKLWKIGPKLKYLPKAVSHFAQHQQIALPTIDSDVSNETELLHATTKRIFANAHAYHINSLALNSDTETFISADDLRINMWKIENSDTTFNLVDIKPENMEELTEVITAVQCHPQHCNILTYSSSRGLIKVCDLRTSAVCHQFSKVYAEHSAPTANKSFITDILNSISDINYSLDGRYIVSRDYLTVKIWDVNMENRPVKTVSLHDYLRPMLYDLYNSDTIFDKFEVCCSPDGKSVATGSYSNQLKIFHQDARGLRNVDLPKTIVEGDTLSPNQAMDTGNNEVYTQMERLKLKDRKHSAKSAQAEVKLDEKVLHCAWHPSSNTIAVAGKSGLCLYKV